MARQSRPLYPSYRTTERAHTLSDDWTDAESYLAWREWALVGRRDVVTRSLIGWQHRATRSLIGWRWFGAAVDDPKATVHAAHSKVDWSPRVVSISWRDGKRAACLFTLDAWPEGCTLADIQATCDALGVGTYCSPSALGQATMRRDTTGMHWTAAVALDRDIREGLVGGRAELLHPGDYATLFETDRRMAFVAECLHPLPDGAATRWFGPDLPDAPACYLRCVVYIRKSLPAGPFPLRLPSGLMSYPTKPGTYENVWLTGGEITDTTDAGCTVVIRDGWCWDRVSDSLAAWARTIFQAREAAATDMTAACIKKAAVAAIGWHAMTSDSLVVVSESACPDGPLILHNDRATDWVVERQPQPYPTMMVAWALFIWSGARRALYQRQLAEIADGNVVVASNFDSLVLVRPSRLELDARVLGAWREQTLTNVIVNRTRWVICDQYRATPGVDGETADEMMPAWRVAAAGPRISNNQTGYSLKQAVDQGWYASE